MTLTLPSSAEWTERCLADGEFSLAARNWSGGIRLKIGGSILEMLLQDGRLATVDSAAKGILEVSGATKVWQEVLAAVPARLHNDIMANISHGLGLALQADPVVFAQYYAALARSLELLRPSSPMLGETMAHDKRPDGNFDSPIGRYVHIQLDGHDHRIYFEEAGRGIPLLMQHTAGCHSSQWRHLFEMPDITDRFRLIAYDLPFHGKSMPPVSRSWWNQQYLLRGGFLRSIPVRLVEVLGLESPVFMGCSVGGLLALDLAHKHADLFRAVISLEGALNIEGRLSNFGELWHPQVNSEYKARLMEGIMAPTSPAPYRKETSFVYASGWPPLFLGDLFYYLEDYDLRSHAREIDTRRVGVHILSGEYDYSGTSELGRAAHEAIPGSSFTEMKGLGHFPMSENPAAFRDYLLPILDRIALRDRPAI